MKPVLVFDVNGTLLDVQVLQPTFQQTFGASNVLKEWFDAILLYSQTATILGEYQDFSQLAKQALRMVSAAKQVPLSIAAEQEIVGGMLALPAYPEVRDALRKLRTSGFRLAALTIQQKSRQRNSCRTPG